MMTPTDKSTLFTVIYFAKSDYASFVVPDSLITITKGKRAQCPWPQLERAEDCFKALKANSSQPPDDWIIYPGVVIEQNKTEASAKRLKTRVNKLIKGQKLSLEGFEALLTEMQLVTTTDTERGKGQRKKRPTLKMSESQAEKSPMKEKTIRNQVERQSDGEDEESRIEGLPLAPESADEDGDDIKTTCVKPDDKLTMKLNSSHTNVPTINPIPEIFKHVIHLDENEGTSSGKFAVSPLKPNSCYNYGQPSNSGGFPHDKFPLTTEAFQKFVMMQFIKLFEMMEQLMNKNRNTYRQPMGRDMVVLSDDDIGATSSDPSFKLNSFAQYEAFTAKLHDGDFFRSKRECLIDMLLSTGVRGTTPEEKLKFFINQTLMPNLFSAKVVSVLNMKGGGGTKTPFEGSKLEDLLLEVLRSKRIKLALRADGQELKILTSKMAIRERIAWYLTKYGAKYIATRKNSVMRESSEFDGLSSKEILARMVEKIKAEDESPKKKCITKRVAEDVKAGRGPEKKKKSKMERADVRMQISKSPALDTKSMAGASKKISSCEESADSDEDRSISTPVKKVKPKRKKTSARDSDENSLSPADAESDGSSCSTKSKSGRPKQTKMKHLDGNLKKEFARLLCSSSSDDES